MCRMRAASREGGDVDRVRRETLPQRAHRRGLHVPDVWKGGPLAAFRVRAAHPDVWTERKQGKEGED